MKRKIVGIFVCMLLIATAVPAVTSLKINNVQNITPSENKAMDVIRPEAAIINNKIPGQQCAPIGGVWIEGQKIHALDGTVNTSLGTHIFVDSDTALVGAYGDSENGYLAGSAYVFIRIDNTWVQQAKLLAPDGQPEDAFGQTVTLSGNTAIIGALYDDDLGANSGSAYVYTRSGTTWSFQAKLLPTDGATDDQFGIGLAIQGDTAFIGANRDDDNGDKSGTVFVFTRTGTTWTQQTKLYPLDAKANQYFGIATYIQGDTAIIGANADDGAKGAAYIFTRTGSVWTQQQKINVSDAGSSPNFGHAVSLSGDTALIAAPGYNGQIAGSAYVFVRNGTTWTRQAKLTASDGQPGDGLGNWAASLDGDTALLGAGWYQHKEGTGAAYIFTRTGTNWTQEAKLLASDGAKDHWFGNSVFLVDNNAYIGAWGDDDQGQWSGSVYVFTKVGVSYSIAGGIGVKAVIKNEGTTDANDIPWQIHVEGGILGRINKTWNGTIDIPAGKSVTVKTGMLLGFGAISITAKVADEEQTETGTQLIIFSMVK